MNETIKLLLIFTFLGWFAGCKNLASSHFSDDQGTVEDEIELAFATPIHADLKTFYDSLNGSTPLPDAFLSRGILAQLLDVQISDEVSFTASDYSQVNPRTDGPVTVTDTFRGVALGSRIIIYKRDRSGQGWAVFDSSPSTILNGANLAQKVRFFLDTKYYEPRRIAELNETINSAEFVFSFIPMYAGFKNVKEGANFDERFMGVVQVIGDAATLGLGSKIRIVRTGAAALVVSAATTRVSSAGLKYINGQATTGDGIDALLAMTEVGLASLLLVKVKLLPAGGQVRNLEEARLVAGRLNRSPEDILKGGLSADELKSLGVPTERLGRILSVSSEGSGLVKSINGKKVVSLSKIVPTFKDEVLLGFDGGHAYLIAGGRRVDGGLFNLTKVKTRPNGFVKEGMLVHLKGLDESSKRQIIDGVIAYKRTPSITCANTACRILQNEGNVIFGSGSLIENFRPSALLNNILEGKLIHIDANKVEKMVDFDIFLTKPTSVEGFIDNVTAHELGMAGVLGGWTSTLMMGVLSGNVDDAVALILPEM